ncbi:MAG TPA: glycosyltransferase family 39 protein [Pyrinomonadaceae bacterium]|nr:glycosyltransferase family 39 protein [Pyrinomonadaceae bacterium]
MIMTLKGSKMPRQDATVSGSGKILAIDPGALPPAITLDAFSVLIPRAQAGGSDQEQGEFLKLSSIDFDSVKSEAGVSGKPFPRRLQKSGASVWSLEKISVMLIGLMVLAGFGLRVSGLGQIGFAEDEINKLEAVRAYDRGDFTANAEHPMLMKALIDVSMRGARAWNSMTGSSISEEAALRFPNVLFGALTAIPLFLLTAALFDRLTGLWAAAFWSFGVNAITYSRIGKEDTLMVFFLLFAFYLFIRGKLIRGPDPKPINRLRNLSAVSFGLVLASKYFPHYLGLNMLYHHYVRVREPSPDEPRWRTPLSFFLIIGATLVLANPMVMLPSVWNYLDAYSGEKLLTHTGYLMGNQIYRNRMSASPFWGLPVHFYFLFLAIKVPLAVMGTFLVGLFVSLRRWRNPGHAFVLFMLFFWLVPYSLVGSKWLRYTLSLMPFVYMGAAIGTITLIRWCGIALEKLRAAPLMLQTATAVLMLILIAVPAWTAYASAPHYAMYTNILGARYAGYFFPHDEFYDDGLNDAIKFVCERAPQGSEIVTEAPGVVRYYTEKLGRADLQTRVLSDPKYTVSDQSLAYVILQRGRTYYENQNEMKEVRERFTLVYSGCVQGHTAAEVYAVQGRGGEPVQPCGDLRP